jgi:hypothetical protein
VGWPGHSVIPGFNVSLLGLRNRVIKLGAIDGTTVRSQLSTKVGIIVRAGLIKGGNITVAATPLAVSLCVMCVEVVASRETAVASGYPANMGFLLGVTLHVSLEMFLSLESALATRLLAAELDLLDD